MKKTKRRAKKKNAKSGNSLLLTEMPTQEANSISITYASLPLVSVKRKKIHNRKPLPKVPVKKQVSDDNPSPDLDV